MKGTGWRGPEMKDPRNFKYADHPQKFIGDLPREAYLPETPIEDQGSIGCCVFKALTSLMENAEFDYYFSALWLYYQYRLKFGDVSQDDGAYIGAAIKLAADIGCVNETLWPYDEDKWNVKPPDFGGVPAQNKVNSYWSLGSVEDILARLAQVVGNVVIFGMPVYESFERVGHDGIVPYPNFKSERFLGGHCMKVCGYKYGGDLIKVKNSWSADWGQDGYCWFPSEMVTDFWSDMWTIDSLV